MSQASDSGAGVVPGAKNLGALPTDGVAEPVTGPERIIAIDVLRGVAILGILIMNIYAFSMPFAAYMNPLLMGGTEPHNLATWFGTHVVFDQKFLSIFAMLFGAGIVLMHERAAANGVRFAPIYFRRTLWLLVIGLIHGYLIWFGDILAHYALMGALVFFLRKLSPGLLVIIACCLLPIGNLVMFAGAASIESTRAEVAEIQERRLGGESLTSEQEALLERWDAMTRMIAPDDEDLRKDVEAYTGSYLDIVLYRAPGYTLMLAQGTVGFVLWRVAPLMLIGMALMKVGVLSGERSSAFYRNLMLGGYLAGLPLTVFSAVNLAAHGFDGSYAFRVGLIPNYYGSILVALGHVGLVLWLVRTGKIQWLMQRFAAAGRMALTNYLMHSLVMTTIFYGYGFGLYGQVSRLAQMGFVVAMLALQLTISPWWLSRYRFGPAEWLWRSLTYARRQPMRLPQRAR